MSPPGAAAAGGARRTTRDGNVARITPEARPAAARWPLVGRRGELERVMEALADPELAGAVISGEPGVGKTRVAAEAIAKARRRGRDCAWTVATRAAATIPFGALAHLLSPPDSAAMSRFDYLRRAALELAHRAQDSSPLVLAVDDAQWLDEGSAALLHQLAVTRSVRLLLTVRGGEPAPDAVTALWAGGLATRVNLEPLSRSELETLASTALDGELAGGATFALWEATRGNPLLLRELMLDALESGSLSTQGEIWSLNGRLTTGVRTLELIEQRLSRLSVRERRALELLAVGEPLPAGVFESLVGESVVARLDDHGLLRLTPRDGEAYLRVAHPLHSEALRERMSALRARNVRRKLADGLAGSAGDGELLRVAVWRLESGGPADPELYTRAAVRALMMFEPAVARRLAGAAIGGGDDFTARELHALAAQFCGDVEAAVAEFQELQGCARNDLQRAVAADGLASALFWAKGDEKGARAVASAARERVRSTAARDRLTALSAIFAGFAGRPAQTASLIDPLLRRLRTSDEIGARAALAAAVGAATAGVSARTGELVERWLPAMGLLAGKFPLARAQLLAAHALALMFAGRLAEAGEIAEDGYRDSLGRASDEATGMWALSLGRLALLRGALDEAGRHLHESAALLVEVDSVGWLSWTHACLGHLAALGGDHDRAARELERSADVARPALRIYAADVELATAWALAARGERSTARMRTLAVVDRTAKAGQLGFAVLAAHQLARLADPVGAVRHLEPLQERVDGPLAAFCLRHARALRERDGAKLEAAAEDFAAVGAGLFAAEAAAEAVAAHREAGDSLRAQAAGQRARALQERVPAARTPPLHTSEREDVLTRREREVAHLAADGLSAREIAERLTLSPRTVENHLQRVYRKLGISGRAELIAAFERPRGERP